MASSFSLANFVELLDNFHDLLCLAGSSTYRVSWAGLSSLTLLVHFSGSSGCPTCGAGDIFSFSVLLLTTRVATSISTCGRLKIDRILIGTTGSPSCRQFLYGDGGFLRCLTPIAGNPAPSVIQPGVGGTSCTCDSSWPTSSRSCCWLSCPKLILLLWAKEKIAFILGNYTNCNRTNQWLQNRDDEPIIAMATRKLRTIGFSGGRKAGRIHPANKMRKPPDNVYHRTKSCRPSTIMGKYNGRVSRGNTLPAILAEDEMTKANIQATRFAIQISCTTKGTGERRQVRTHIKKSRTSATEQTGIL